MENTIEVNTVLDKKLDGYGVDARLQNFIAPQEITVTITISEYRELVREVATKQADIAKAESDKYERNRKIEDLTKENAELKSRLYDLQSSMNNAKGDEIMADSQKEPRLNPDEMF